MKVIIILSEKWEFKLRFYLLFMEQSNQAKWTRWLFSSLQRCSKWISPSRFSCCYLKFLNEFLAYYYTSFSRSSCRNDDEIATIDEFVSNNENGHYLYQLFPYEEIRGISFEVFISCTENIVDLKLRTSPIFNINYKYCFLHVRDDRIIILIIIFV